MTWLGTAQRGLRRWERSRRHGRFFTHFYRPWSSQGRGRARRNPAGPNPRCCHPGVFLRQVRAEEKVFQGRERAVSVLAERRGRLGSRQGGDLVVRARSYRGWDGEWLTGSSAPVLVGGGAQGCPGATRELEGTGSGAAGPRMNRTPR